MKSKINPFRSTAFSGAAVVFACFSMLNTGAQAADQLWTGFAGDELVNTAGNWVAAPDLFSFQKIVFGSDVVNGTMQLQPWVTSQGITLTSGCTTPITINGANFLNAASGPIDMSAAVVDLTINAAWMTGWGDISMNVGAGRTLTLNGAVGEAGGWAGGASFVKNGAGKAVLNAGPVTTAYMPNPSPSDGYYTGPTSINEGTLSVTYDGSGNAGIGTLPVGSSITVSSGATLLASGINALGYGSTHASDQLTVNKGGSLTVGAGVVASMPYALNVVGGTIASVDGGDPTLGTLYYASTSGTFTSASDGTPATISAQNFNLQGAQFNVVQGGGAVDLNVTGSFTGGALTKNGNGVMALSTVGAVGYTGATTVNGGTLIMPSGSWQLNAIANYPITVNPGATLQLPSDPNAYTVGPTLNGGTISSSGVNLSGWPNISLVQNCTVTVGGAAVSTISTWLGFCGNGTFSVGSGSTLNLTGRLTGDWIDTRTGVFKTGDGMLTLSSAANDYDCGTTISGGTLAIGGAGQLNGGNYGYNIINNAALVYGSSAAQTLSGVISGTGPLTQNAGTLTLSGANTYSGATTVNGGFLDINNTASVGNTSGITVNGAYGYGGYLRFDSGTDGGTISTPISVIGGDYDWNMGVNVPNNLTFTGPINLSGAALIVSGGGNSTLNFNNAFHGTEGLNFAALSGAKNFFVLSVASDFTGDVSLINWSGSPQITLSGGDNRLPATAVVRLAGSTGSPSALDLNGNNQTIAGLGDAGWGGVDAGTRHVVNTSGTAVTLTLNTTADQSSGTTIGGTDINGTAGNNLALVKSGSGTQTLSGANTYSGTTTVSGGTLTLGASNVLPDGSHVTLGNATLNAATFTDTAGTLAMSGSGTIHLGAGAALAFADSHLVAWSGTLTLTGTYVSGSSLRFGTDANGLTSGQLASISKPGGGTVALNASGYLVDVVAGYALWKSINAPTGTTADDYDGDGVSNGVEFVLGGTKDTNDLSKLPAISTSGTNMVFTFQRAQASIDGTTTVAIQVGTNLITWPDSYNVPGTAQVNNPGVTVVKDTALGFDTVTLIVPHAPDATKFARLVVTPAP